MVKIDWRIQHFGFSITIHQSQIFSTISSTLTVVLVFEASMAPKTMATLLILWSKQVSGAEPPSSYSKNSLISH
jgi:hypothetical protein